MLALGIDPGVAITGYGLVAGPADDARLVASGTITTPSTLSLSRRLLVVHDELAGLIARYQPQVAAVEELFFGRNARTALAVGHGRGVALLTLAEAGLDIHEYTPMQVKQAVVGYGRATKEQVQEMIRLLLHLEAVPQPDDAADAVAVAFCHLQSARLGALLRSIKDLG
ncbi:MAG TPA: crossover junction endodeoxyribonuclease RuvC [Anaerolineae bacterium]|nr:crossover junction endodeoxyribonuclease RuvC [Anaerolineae bacterium]HOR01021.1 crossover junction endodeoxyribonuclease RuvC [Anaerolineae bacterium]HPL29173.1 crossover junction endodeoxyribonuclease RuvC [Anaerolineae bacterium]